MAKRRIETEIDINAPAAKVWAVLTDFPKMPLWNPFITAIAGTPAAGERLTITVRPPGKSAVTLHPTLLVAEPERELRWRGHFMISGIFDGEHYFLLDPLGDNRTRLTHGESFSGLLVGFLQATLDATENGFNNMNAALKQQAELSLA
ncbi:MAG TPA: SRPBCC domain-containing protein [Xanthobacteraceae bacterium]|nr:SRPBCC domain-containing protein [Xanthobacteraceae bacterium]